MRNKFVFVFKNAGIFLFLLLFVYAVLMKIFGGSLFPGKFLFVIFFSSLFFILLLAMPPKWNRENSYAWFFFISLMLIFWPFAIGFTNQEFHLFVMTGITKIILGISLSLGFIGFFSSFLFGDKAINKNQTKLNVINSFKNITEKLSLTSNDKSTDKTVILEAEGEYKSEHISLAVEFTFGQRFTHGHNIYADKSIILIKTRKELPSYKIEVFRQAFRSENLDELQKSKIFNFIQEKHLDYFDFDINTFENKIIVNINNQIEEAELWTDYIRLAEMLSE
jgi:hypothetical protein